MGFYEDMNVRLRKCCSCVYPPPFLAADNVFSLPKVLDCRACPSQLPKTLNPASLV